MQHIALFGTSADPPTAAHQEILVWLSHHFDGVAVWASDNPFKSHQTSLEHRMRMLSLMIQAIDPPRQNIQLFPDLSSPRAVVTVERARAHWKQAEFTLVIGSDLVPQLPRWYRVEDLLRQVKLLVIPRPGFQLEAADLETVQQMGARVAIADLTGLPISSTRFRETHASGVLTPPIEEYIHREKLYTCQDAAPKSLLPSGHSPSSKLG